MKLTHCLIIFISLGAAGQNLPTLPNRMDAGKLRHGPWVIWMDARWQLKSDSLHVAYYRLVTYKNDKPTGITADYYRNDKLQNEGTLLEDRPQELFDGTQTWYYP